MQYFAYIISPALLETLKRIAVLVHDLNRRLPGETLRMELIAEARTASAHAAMAISGNPLRLSTVKQLLKSAPETPRPRELEAINYNDALAHIAGQPFSTQLILEVHRRVTAGLLPDEKRGIWRREPVFVRDRDSGEVIYRPPEHEKVPALMGRLHAFIEAHPNLDQVIVAGLFHRQFMLIQPFSDGNGRSVHLLSAALLRNLGPNLFPLLSFESYFGNKVRLYFRQVGDQEASFSSWLEFWAGGILAELQRLEQTLERHANPVRLKPHHRVLLAWLDERRSISDREYALLVDRAKATRALDFRFLQQHGLIKRRGSGPATFYVKGDTS